MLPHTLAAIDSQMRLLRQFRRVRPNGAQGGDGDAGWAEGRLEEDYDRLFANCLGVIEDLLYRSGDIEPTSKLKLLSNPPEQVLNIDILLAEVGPDPNNEFRRLVLVEDKRATNAESRRAVLAQILDYARIVQSSLSRENFSEAIAGSEWMGDNWDDISRATRAGDYLLVICGDHIHPSLLDLLQSYVDRLSPLNASNVVLIEMAVYSDGDLRVFVPHIVGGSRRATRDLTIRLEVQTTGGSPLNITSVEAATTATGTPRLGGRVVTSPEVFMASFIEKCGQQAADAWAALASAVHASGIPGIGAGNYDGGAPYLSLSNTHLGSVQLLRLADTDPIVRDRLNTATWESSPEAQRARAQFRNALLEHVPNAALGGRVGRVEAPVGDFAGAHEAVIDAMRALRAELLAQAEVPKA
jgi:hypothetical protein